MKINPDIDNSLMYMEYLRAGFADPDHICSEPAALIKKWRLTVSANKVEQTNANFDRIIKRSVRKYSVGYMMAEKNERNYKHKQGKHGFGDEYCSKMLFGVRADTLKKQLLKEIGFRIDYNKY